MENSKRIGFGSEIWTRFKAPWTPIFVGYLCIVIAAGGVSVALTAYDVFYQKGSFAINAFKIAESLGTFFISIVAVSFIDLNICTKLQNKKAFTTWSYLFGGFSLILLLITFKLKGNSAFIPSVIGTLIALFTWVIANADNEKIIYEDDYHQEIQDKTKDLKGAVDDLD
jgi:hypothetical protein